MITIRRMTADDGPILKEVRCGALADSPDAFVTLLADALKNTDEQWSTRAANYAAGGHFAFYNDIPCGMASFYTEEEDEQTRGHLGGMWVAPEYRRFGAGKLLVDAVADYARACGFDKFYAWVRETGIPARKFYSALGFIETGERIPVDRLPGVEYILLVMDI
jgi:ribosomal protein S18 acetylase RimI-like enzyme